RAQAYRKFMQGVVSAHSLDLHVQMMVCMRDEPSQDYTCPVFAFQKSVGSKEILVPDIDFLLHDFYESNRFQDTVLYKEKIISAAFAGSTTGSTHTVASIRALESQRIRSALYFRDKPDVDFRLTNAIGYETAEARRLLLEMGFGSDRV